MLLYSTSPVPAPKVRDTEVLSIGLGENSSLKYIHIQNAETNVLKWQKLYEGDNQKLSLTLHDRCFCHLSTIFYHSTYIQTLRISPISLAKLHIQEDKVSLPKTIRARV